MMPAREQASSSLPTVAAAPAAAPATAPRRRPLWLGVVALLALGGFFVWRSVAARSGPADA